MTESSEQPSNLNLDQLYEQALQLRDRVAAKLVLQDLNLEVEEDLKAFAAELVQVTAELAFVGLEEDHNSLDRLRIFAENLVVFTRLLQQTAATNKQDIRYLRYLQSWFKDDVVGAVQQRHRQPQQAEPQIAEFPGSNPNIPPRPRGNFNIPVRPRSGMIDNRSDVENSPGEPDIPRRPRQPRRFKGELNSLPPNSGGDVSPPPPPPFEPTKDSEPPIDSRPVEFPGGDFNPPPSS